MQISKPENLFDINDMAIEPLDFSIDAVGTQNKYREMLYKNSREEKEKFQIVDEIETEIEDNPLLKKVYSIIEKDYEYVFEDILDQIHQDRTR